ncbi:SET domain-containing protein [Aaosphaeria arxii CBS 175.79]|uniref:SET domain-containing protein n=1 Tax=Aaosphaeria arxii CBS 175.79 TaxID=1450172 RepID=A0A6A5XAR3_9PLEO|nr:SET domain-containing protein [Aaosphaeria arxii CBS 175.79]KAF2010165.1 SET domain-containing protein [Aaosphaeria arxii CBS 175.79]
MEDAWAAGLEAQKTILREAERRKGEKPNDLKSREESLRWFSKSVRDAIFGEDTWHPLVRLSFLTPTYPPCTTPLAQLEPITIEDLGLETHHRGRYIALRAITPPLQKDTVVAIAEDVLDRVTILQLCLQEEEGVRTAGDIINVGTVVLVKEPFFKITETGDYALRVDHPSDLIYASELNELYPREWRQDVPTDAKMYKVAGDLAMGNNKYWKAIEAYTNALVSSTDPDAIAIIKRNRSLAYLKTHQFDAALLDSGYPNFGPKPSEKALFRAGEALYSLQRFEECRQVLETLHTEYPQNPLAKPKLERAQNRYVEMDTGVYNFKAMQRDVHDHNAPDLDYATYIGPVEIRESIGKGRGLFLTEYVKAGALILCEKAFARAHVPQTPEPGSITTMLIDPFKDIRHVHGQAELQQMVTQKIYTNPSLASRFTTLHCGTYETVNESVVDETPVVDAFLAHAITWLNMFACPISSLHSHRQDMEEETRQGPTPLSILHGRHSVGIWTHASYLNHSCTSNTRRSFIGDMMIVRATRDLDAGTELSFWYQVPDFQLSPTRGSQQERLQSWGFTCTCAICQDENHTTTATLEERMRIIVGLKRAYFAPTEDKTKTQIIKRQLKALNATYTQPAEDVPRLLVWQSQLELAQLYIKRQKPEKALNAAREFFTSLGYRVVGLDATTSRFEILRWGLFQDRSIQAFFVIYNAFLELQDWQNAKVAAKYAMTAVKVVVGEDDSLGL